MLNQKGFPDASPGINEPLCGWSFVWQHRNDSIPNEIELSIPGARYNIKAKKVDYAIEAIKILAIRQVVRKE